VGRKKPLLIGAFCITLALFAEAGLNAANPNGTRQGYSIGGVFFLFLVSVIFSLSFGPISWVYMSEIMPMQIRGRGCAFATGIGNWLVSTFFAQISPIALGKIGWVGFVGNSEWCNIDWLCSQRFYFVFASWNILITIPTIWFLFKETNKKSLEEIDLLFGERALGTLPEHIEAKDVDDAIRRGSTTDEKNIEVSQARVAEHNEKI
jgi:MFS family permease